MTSRHLLFVAVALGFAAFFSPSVSHAIEAPRIQSVQRKVVFVEVPSGYTSITLQQRDRSNSKTWRILATRETSVNGGVVRIRLNRVVTRRGLFVSGKRALPEFPAGGPITSFAADPDLQASSGLRGVGGATPGVVSLARASADSVSVSGSAPIAATREVSESDIWRVEGDRLYFFNQLRGLQVFDIADPDAPVLLGQLREPNRGEQMYLLDTDHVAMLTRESYFFSLANRPFSLAENSSTTYLAGSGALVIADVSQGKPAEVARLSYPGYLVESRLVGTALYLVSQVYTNSGDDGLVVTSYDLSDPADPEKTDTLLLGGYGDVVTATDRFLFVSRYSDDWTHSIIEVVDISAPDGTLVQGGQITAAGQVPDKFKLHLKGDVLTVVSAVPRNWNGNPNAPRNQSRTKVENFSLSNPLAPVKLGSLELGIGETVHATRFSGDRLYVVTFLTIDPLWVVDLSNPNQPTLLGELEVPGFSTYIEPLGDRLVGIGRVGSQTAVSLFDVTDPSAPTLLSQLPLGEGYSYSEANWDEKAFSVFPDDKLILVPYSGYDRASGWASRIQLIDLERDQLAKRGIVDHGFAARRTAVVGDRILAISASDLVTVNFADRDNPEVTSDVEIAWRVDRVFLSGGYLVEVGGSADWTRSSSPTLTIATPDDPDGSLNLVELENAPVTGATVRDGKLYLAQQEANSWGVIYNFGIAKPAPNTNSVNPLILSVYDLSNLPEVSLLGRTETQVDVGYGYGSGQLEPAWPNDDTLVWVRENWSSWWWYDYPVALADDVVGIASAKSVTPSGSAVSTNLNLGSGGTPAASRVAVADAGVSASSLVAADSLRIIAPWYRTSVGHEMVVFDVSDPAAPQYTATVDARIGQTGDWSVPLALDGKLYLSSMAYDYSSLPYQGRSPRGYRHYLRVVDFADPAHPVVSEEINIPGRLLTVTNGGETLVTTGCRFDLKGRPFRHGAYHTSHFDGSTVTLVDQIPADADDPHAVDGRLLFTANSSNPKNGLTGISAWQVGVNENFKVVGQVAAPFFWNVSLLNGLLVGYGDGLPEVYDVGDPSNPIHLEGADTSELTNSDLSNADGGAGLGIWQAQGDSGVGVVRLPK